jgi:hypothetical protein
MAALKLFISHSSRLRPASADDAEAQANWQLLQDTCKALKAEYSDKIEILVDYEGLHPGDDWERRLNEWLAECHAAIILFSRRAIEESNWVRKEARSSVGAPNSIPDSGSSRSCSTSRPAPRQISTKTRTSGHAAHHPHAVRCRESPPPRRFSAASGRSWAIIPRILRGAASKHPSNWLLEAVERTSLRAGEVNSLERCGSELFPANDATRHRRPTPTTPGAGAPPAERRREVPRALPGSARRHAATPEPRTCRRAVEVRSRAVGRHAAPRGRFRQRATENAWRSTASGWPAQARELGTPHFTLDRYLERAWPGRPDPGNPGIRREQPGRDPGEIRKATRAGLAHLTNEVIDRRVSKDKWHVVVFVPPTHGRAKPPIARLVDGLQKLQQLYGTPVFVFGVGEQMRDDLPEDLSESGLPACRLDGIGTNCSQNSTPASCSTEIYG